MKDNYEDKLTCNNCLWNDHCDNIGICEDYYPLNDFDDEYIDDYIEKMRYEFYKQYFILNDVNNQRRKI